MSKIEDTLRQELKAAAEKLQAAEVQNDEHLRVMSTIHSLLSLVLHRHLPLNLDSLKKDIEKSLSVSEVVLRPWWKKEMDKHEKRSESALICDRCGKAKPDVKVRPNGYQQEINDKKDAEWTACNDCNLENNYDI